MRPGRRVLSDRWGCLRQPGLAIITQLPGHARRAFPGSGTIGMDSPAPPPIGLTAADPFTGGVKGWFA